MTTRDVHTLDGRRLRTVASGPHDGYPVVWHHGNPGSSVPPVPAATLEQTGVRLFSYARPGGGGSTARPGRRVADGAEDVRALAEAWGIERFGTAGISGGGAYTLATAALAGDLVAAAAVLSGAAPIDAEGLDFTSGMNDNNTDAAEGAGQLDREAELREGEPLRQALLADPRGTLGQFAQQMSASDRAVLEDDVIAGAIADGMADCVRESAEGWLDDSHAFAGPWGFDVAAIAVPVEIWQGREDTATPIEHARWLAARIPGARLHELDGGHYAPYPLLPEIFAWLASHR